MNMPPEIRKTLLEGLEYLKGDDLERCRNAFRNCTPEQMQRVWSGNGETRQQVLDGYVNHRKKVTDAIEWLDAQS